MSDYRAFLEGKMRGIKRCGFRVELAAINQQLFPFQQHSVQWALELGRAALFYDCGLGKTPMQLEWARHVAAHTGGKVLILAPLAVSQQTIREGHKFGVTVGYAHNQDEVREPITITNYENLEKFRCDEFDGVVLDESSILKNFMGRTKQLIIERFRHCRFKLACSATPAPNDYMEIGNHCDFLDVMPANEMLSRWFINDSMNFGNYRLKGHAVESFWRWVASWAASASKPSDIGFEDDGFILPPLHIHERIVPVDHSKGKHEGLFRASKLTATSLHEEMRLTAPDRASVVAAMVNESTEPWVVWCNTNYEADELTARIPDAVEVRGSELLAVKERKIEAFSAGRARVIISKPSICGLGLNWQHCSNVAFVGLSYSYEDLYQAIRRSYRFGQTKPVEVHIVTAESEGDVVNTVRRKMEAHTEMQRGMYNATRELLTERKLALKLDYDHRIERGERWTMHLGDCVDIARGIGEHSIDFSVFSPPFANLYIYSDSIRDMGNCADDGEFFEQFDYLIPELYRITRPGRLCAVHCKQLVNYKGRDGMAGLRDFRGEIIRHFLDAGWAFHSEVTIWKDPVIEMQRTKAHGLLYKQLRKDSSFSRQGMAEYLCVFRKWTEPGQEALVSPVEHTHEDFPLDQWQEWASPVWHTIQQTNVLNTQLAREDRDEKHICPLQLDVIERAVKLWTNPGDVVFSPFAGIGSEGYVSVLNGRRFEGCELKEAYFHHATKNLASAELETGQLTIFDVLTAANTQEAAPCAD